MCLKAWLAVGLVCVSIVSGADEVPVYAAVNGDRVTRAEVDAASHMALRRQFYHGKVDERRMAELRHEVGQQLIDRVLLKQEAVRRGLRPSAAEIEAALARELVNYNLTAVDAKQQARVKSMLQEQVEEQLLLDALKAGVVNAGVVDESSLRNYYSSNIDKFTTPEQVRLSVILLNVQPSAPVAVWEAARREAGQLLDRLQRGASFAELAAIHSSDASAERGGDLGFVHQGMLSEEAQQAVDGLLSGGVSPVVVLLQGVAIFRLEARKAAEINPFSDVKARVRDLRERDEGQRRWQALLERLRAGAQVVINDNKAGL